MSDWVGVPESLEDYQGFVYKITHKPTGKYYIGKKFYWSKRTLRPLKGHKNKRHRVVESDWKDYWGSSNKFKEFREEVNDDSQFRRKILHNCKTKFECSYIELLYQLEYDVLFDKKSFNEIINVRLRKRK